MSSPQYPYGSGSQPWHDPNAQNPGAEQQPPAGPYGSAPGRPGPYGSGPYGSAPSQQGPSGATPGRPGPGQFGSGPGSYGSGPGPAGAGPYGSAPGPYGSAPGQPMPGAFGPGPMGAPAAPKRTGPGLLGPLTLRDLFLLFAGLLALIVLMVPYMTFGAFTGGALFIWHWNVDMMTSLFLAALPLLGVAVAVLVNKFGSGRLRVGSLSLDQAIGATTTMVFAVSFLHLITTVPYWHVGQYLLLLASLIAFFAGVFTMIPFFATEFTVRADMPAHPKARPVAKRSAHPAPLAPLPGTRQPGGQHPEGAFGPPAGPASQFGPGGQPGPGAPFGAPGQFGPGVQAGPGFPSESGVQAGPEAPAGQGVPFDPRAAAGQEAPGSPTGSGAGVGSSAPLSFGQPSDGFADAGTSAAQPAFGAPAQSFGDDSRYAPPQEAWDHSSDQSVQSTGDGQTYLGSQHSQDPKHSQSEPTQAFGFGVQGEAAWSTSSEPSAPQPSEEDSSAVRGDVDETVLDLAPVGDQTVGDQTGGDQTSVDRSGAEESTASNPTESRRGRHSAAPVNESDQDEDSIPTDTADADASPEDAPSTFASAPDAEDGSAGDSAPTVDSSPADDSSPAVDSIDGSAAESDRGTDEGGQSTAAAAPVSSETSTTTDPGEADPAAEARSERSTAPESDEPTQYVPMSNFRDEPTQVSRVVGSPEDSDGRDADAHNDGNGDRQSYQAFWFAVPEPREAVDPTTGLPVFTIYPGDWFLGLEDHGSWFTVRDADGRVGLLRNLDRIQRG